MTDKPTEQGGKPKTDEIKDLPPKKVSPQDEENTKGGGRRRIDGTTDDSI